MNKVILLTAVLFACNTNQKKDVRLSLLSKLDSIDKRVNISPDPHYLINDSLFLEVFNDSEFYLDSITYYMISDKISDRQKLICVFAMQKLDSNNYATFALNGINGFRDSLLSELVLGRILFPRPWSPRVNELKGNPMVLNAIQSIANDKRLAKNFSEAISREFSVDIQPCDTLIYRVESFITDLTNPRELFLSKDFLEIYNNALKCEECIRGVLESKQYNFVQKQICVYSLQKISNAQYIEFVIYCLKLYKEGRIDDKLLSLVLTPAPFDSKNRIIDNYSDKNIQAVLKSIIDSPVSSTPMMMKAESILSGKAFHDLEKMRKKEF